MPTRTRRALSPTRFLSNAELERGARAIATLGRVQGFKVAIVGGYAMAHYKSKRMTTDLDVIVSTPATTRPRGLPVRDRLPFGGFETVVAGIPVDIIQRNDSYTPLYQAALKAAKVKRSGSKIPVVPLEFLAAMKLAAHRDKDLMDLEYILRSGLLNVPRAREIVGYFVGGQYAVADLNRLLEIAVWKNRRRAE